MTREQRKKGNPKNKKDLDRYRNRKWGTTRKRETKQWRKRMTKETCKKKVASGELAFLSYDHPVWDTVGIKHMAEE